MAAKAEEGLVARRGTPWLPHLLWQPEPPYLTRVPFATALGPGSLRWSATGRLPTGTHSAGA